MISSRSIVSPPQDGSQTAGSPGNTQAHAVHQDHQGPLDGELLDLYVAILIAVPLACLLRALWF
jgi:hypothetical protein